MFGKIKSIFIPAIVAIICSTPVMALAVDPFVVPDLDTATLYSVASKAFAGLVIFLAIGLGMRLFKKI